MKKLVTVFASAALLTPCLGIARDTTAGAVDIYAVPKANLDITIPGLGSDDDDGDGFGAKTTIRFAGGFALNAEYQSVKLDEFDIDVDQTRVGLGFLTPSHSGVLVEHDSIELDGDDADGFSLHGRLAGKVAPNAQLYGDIGYLMLNDDDEDINGFEFTLGGALSFNRNIGAFVDYRITNLEGEDSEVGFDFKDLRVGARFMF
jgi:hypothetical protein